MPTYKITLEYEGTRYAGWQRQPDLPTIQEEIEKALFQITRTPTSIVGAGRTDAGVHALGQVASFQTKKKFTDKEWLRALNGVLPPDIGVTSIEPTAEAFHARYQATSKIYEYRIFNKPEKPVLDRFGVWHIPRLLDVSPMQEAAFCLQGHQDFSSFEGPCSANNNPLCHLQQLVVQAADSHLIIRAQADRFLKQMVRAIVGTLVEVGQKKRTPESLREVLQKRDRRAAGQTAPPQGLYLVKVDYE